MKRERKRVEVIRENKEKRRKIKELIIKKERKEEIIRKWERE